MSAMVYADDDMVVTGDHIDIDPNFTAQRNALLLAGSAMPNALESVCQVVEYIKSWITAMHAGRAVPGPYTNAAGTSITDASTARAVKALGYFFQTDMRDDSAIYDAISTKLHADAEHIARELAPPGIRMAAVQWPSGPTAVAHVCMLASRGNQPSATMAASSTARRYGPHQGRRDCAGYCALLDTHTNDGRMEAAEKDQKQRWRAPSMR